MKTLDVPNARRVVRARARAELAPLDYNREIRAAAAVSTQTMVAELTHLSQPRINQIVKTTVEQRPGFHGATPTEIAQRFAVGELSDRETIDELGRWEYVPLPKLDECDDLWEPGSGTWLEVENALSDGLITDEVYVEALHRYSARVKDDG